VAARDGGEEQRRVDARRQSIDCGECARRQRHATAPRLRVGRQHAVSEPALHDDGGTGSIDVAPLDRRPLVRTESRLGAEDHERSVDGAKLDGERVDLVAGERP
jgi:hypothetical protein